jgi:hypothetical protein
MLGAHLHTQPCSRDGGGHYRNNVSGPADTVNENWPGVVCDASGVCGGHATNAWMPRASAIGRGLSVVVHDTPNGNPKMICADLAPAKTYSGRFTTLSSYVGAGYGSVSGVAELTVERRGMHSRIVVIGTAAMAGQTFNAHLHASSCAVNSGGGHYQDPGNPGVVDAVSENWPTLVCGSSGACTGGASSSWIALSGALTSGLSVVIHDTPNAASGSGSKMLCADLLPPRVYTGAFSQLASYSGAGYAGSSGVAKLEVSSTGITSRVHFMGPTASVG